jgi:hypothetical protein
MALVPANSILISLDLPTPGLYIPETELIGNFLLMQISIRNLGKKEINA